MANRLVRAVVITTVVVAACITQTQMREQKQDMALQTALSRARFDMNCPQAIVSGSSEPTIRSE